MSAMTLSSGMSYRFPTRSNSAFSFLSEEWREVQTIDLMEADAADQYLNWVSTASSVAQSIAEFDRMIRQVLIEFHRLFQETQPIPVGLDVEQEVVAHLPPKRQFETTLRVRYSGRAKPNITLELMDDDL